MRMAMGANTAVMIAATINTHHTSPLFTVPIIKPRDASVKCVTGFSDTTVCIQPGMVTGLTKMLLTKVMGNSNNMLVVITDSGVFTSMPTMIHSHDTADTNNSINAIAATTPTKPPAGRKPSISPTNRTTVAANA